MFYDKNVTVDYIHGMATQNAQESDIVIGYGGTDNAIIDKEFMKYRKSNKRAARGTDDRYKMVLKKYRGEIETVFYGHSMSVMDADIIRQLLPGDAAKSVTKSYIYCHENKDDIFNQLVAIYGIDWAQQLVHPDLSRGRKVELVGKSEWESVVDGKLSEG